MLESNICHSSFSTEVMAHVSLYLIIRGVKMIVDHAVYCGTLNRCDDGRKCI